MTPIEIEFVMGQINRLSREVLILQKKVHTLETYSYMPEHLKHIRIEEEKEEEGEE